MEKIFIQIASYRDPQLNLTLTDCIAKAKYPERFTFGICRQYESSEVFLYHDDSRFKIINIPWQESRGCCWARSLCQQLYNDETYTLQIDSHMRFSLDWDVALINMLKSLNNKSIITTYTAGFDIQNDTVLTNTLYKMVPNKFEHDAALTFLPEYMSPAPHPIPAKFISGHYYFTYGIHCRECPYDPWLYFIGEEITLSVRSYTHGYDLYHPNKVLIWHEYTRENRSKHWDDHNVENKEKCLIKKAWYELNDQSIKRVQQLLNQKDHNIDLSIYGLGKVHSLQEYEFYANIDFKNRIINK